MLEKINKVLTPIAVIASFYQLFRYSFIEPDKFQFLLWSALLVLNSIFFIRQIKGLD